MSVPMDAQAMVAALNADFMNKMQLASNIMVNYDGNTIGLFSKADYAQRRKPISVIFGVMQHAQQRQIKIWFDLKDCDFFLDECFKKVKNGTYIDKDGNEKKKWKKVLINPIQYEIWTNLKEGTLRLQSQNDAILEQVKSGLALYRGTGVFDAFEAYEDAVSDILGLEKKGVKQAYAAKDQAIKSKNEDTEKKSKESTGDK